MPQGFCFFVTEKGTPMALKVRDVLQLQSLKGMKLLAGKNGLDRSVCSAGIADYEFVPGVEYHNDTPFEKESFVISSLLFAQQDEARILKAVKDLYEAGTAALAFKNIIYEKLPQEVIDFSDEHGFPIFMFGQEVYFENIIYEIMDAVQQDDSRILTDQNIKLMIENKLPKDEVLQISKGISLLFRQYARGVYLKEKDRTRPVNMERILRNYYLSKTLKDKCILCRYDKGIFILMTGSYGEESKFEVILKEITESLSIPAGQLYICRSRIYRPYEKLDSCFRESYHTCSACIADKKDYAQYTDIGTFQYLVPLQDSHALNQFATSLLAPILDKEEFMNTLKIFVINNGDITATAIDCGCHQNTVRYRLSKIKELTGLTKKTELEFYAEVSAAIRIYLLRGSI